MPLHCEGCTLKIQKLVCRTKGYLDMCIDKEKELVTVKGAMDMKAKLKNPVEIVPPKKDKNDGGSEKRADDGGGDGGDGKGNINNNKNNKMVQCGVQYGYGYGYGYGYEYGYLVVYGPGYVHAPEIFSDENSNACVVM